MNLSELITLLQTNYEIYGDIRCLVLDGNANINASVFQPTVKYEQDDELFDFENVNLKYPSEPVLLINPQ